MKKRKTIQKRSVKAMGWFPIDSRLFPSLISFNHVKGVARVFLTCELLICSLIVIGAVILIILKFIPLK